MKINDFTLDVNKDDCGRWVAEVWDTASGRTLAITELPSKELAAAWAHEVIKEYEAKESTR